MSRSAQASVEDCVRVRGRAALLAVLPAILLSACASGGFGLDKVEVDPSIVTGSTGPSAGALDPNQLSDEATIRNAVSVADMDSMAGAPLPWANAATGTRGTITSLSEVKGETGLCRSFTTSRERYDGIALFKGEACMAGPGVWRLTSLAPL